MRSVSYKWYVFVSAGFCLAGFTGCAKVAYLDEALTLQEFSKETDAQHALVAEHDRRFEALLSAARAEGFISKYHTKSELTAAFGDPVLVVADSAQLPEAERLLYRHAAKYFNTAKVYVSCDAAGFVIGVTIEDSSAAKGSGQ